MSKKSKTKTESQQTVVNTPTNPQWVTDSATRLQDRINGLLDVDPRTMIPGVSNLQSKAFAGAEDMGAWRGGNAAAQDAAAGLMGASMGAQQASSRSLLDLDLDGYMNPYLESVVDTSLAGFDEQRGMQEAEMRAQQARNQKFSGSGDAIRRAMFDRGTLQDRTGIEAGLRKEGYDRATGLAMSDLDREAETSRFNAGQSNTMTVAERDAQLRGAGLLGDLSNNQAANERADLGLLTDLGNIEREIEREELGATPRLLQLVSALNAGQPYNLFHGNSTTGTGSSTSSTKESGLGNVLGTIGQVLGGVGSAAQGAAMAGAVFSDKRLKTDVETVGKDDAGRRLVSYRYKGEPENVRRVGHIAQEVAKTDPHAVRKVGKYLAIDYGLLGA